MGQVLGTTKLLGVMGCPVTHSLSPVMHNAALTVMQLDYVYIPLPVAIDDLTVAVSGLKAVSALQGFNLTIPHKQEIMPMLDRVDGIAQAVGAVNTVKRVEDGWVGTNTDVAGFLAPLKSLALNWHRIPAVILGSGGAARAAIAGCLQLGCSAIHIVGRDSKKMKRFHGQMTSQLNDYNLRVHTWNSLPNLLEIAGLVVNATPIGMAEDPNTPISAEDMALLPESAIVYDLIYIPRPTRFLQLATARGLKAMDGLDMLLHQGAIALEFWVGQPAPIDVMQQALLNQLASRS
ncbi:shikimate dehydrogenase [Tumidithrix helvetica PCC 7403]|uniref:shikimate dehydrogenase n=1 Tax=Tumidithrix helvetica TaxID=3457545 RepID=UPI003C9BEF2D